MLRMLVTRPEPDAHSTLARLWGLGIAALATPLMVRHTLDFRLPSLSGFAALAVTSANALRALEEKNMLTDLYHLPLFALGDRTAHEAREMGFPQVVTAGGTFKTLATAIALARISGPVFYPAGRHRSGDLAHALAPQGIMVVTVAVYDMVAEEKLPETVLAGLESGQIGAVLLYSPRTAAIFCAASAGLSRASRSRLAVLCLSEAVAQPCLAAHFTRVHLADRPDEDAMMTLALAFAREQIGS